MSQIVKVDQVSDIKQGQYGFSSKIHCGNAQYFVNADATELIGKQVEIEVTEKKSAKGNVYKIAKVVKVIEPSSNGAGPSEESPTDGRPTLAQFVKAMTELHTAILLLEPDDYLDTETNTRTFVDRAEQRAKILISAMIAVSDGRIALVGEGDESPF